MSAGQIVFMIGIGLLALTIILAIIFHLKEPQYIPGSAAYKNTGRTPTQKPQSSYFAGGSAIHREPEEQAAPETVILDEEGERLTGGQTELLPAIEPMAETRF